MAILLPEPSGVGCGIPAAAQAHVFDKFGAAARGVYSESTTGLGQQIVRLHGGTIWLESQKNEGTTFFIDFP